MSLAALKRPFGMRMLPGILFTAIPIISFFAMGYKMACARTAMSQNYELPHWKGWKNLFLFGLGARFLQALYLSPAILIGYVLWKYGQNQIVNNQITSFLVNMGFIKNMLVLLAVLVIFAAFLGPASILNYVAEGRFKAAFSYNMIKRMLTISYLKGWALSAMYGAVVAIFFTVMILSVGFTASAALVYATLPIMYILLFVPGITIWTLLGEAWGKSISGKYRAS